MLPRRPVLRHRPTPWLALLLATAAVARSPEVRADESPRPAPGKAQAIARASGGQPELSVGFDAQGKLTATIYSAPGTKAHVKVLEVPESLLLGREKSRLQIVPIGEQRHAIIVSLPTDAPNRTWQALIVAKPGQSDPEVLFANFTGFVEGEEGLRRGPVLEISDPIDDSGTRRIVFGEMREDLTLCGRPATLSPQMLSPKDLAFKPAKVQRLSAQERDQAVTLTALPQAPRVTTQGAPQATVPSATNATNVATTGKTQVSEKSASEPPLAGAAVPATTASPLGRQASLLRASGATSAIGWPDSLTDGNPETTWAENRGGTGRGEFVTFKAPSDVPLSGFDFVVRPVTRQIPKGVGPSQLWLATRQQLFAIKFPSDPWKAPGISFHVSLPAPVQTDCVAVVMESAYGENPDAEVTLADVRANSEFESASIEQLVGALAGGGPRADAAGSILSALGAEALQAVASAFGGLDEGGKRVALDVLDHGNCVDASPIYIQALQSPVEAHRLHAIDRLHRCGPAIVAPLEQALGDAPAKAPRALLELFAEVAPDRAILFLVPRLSGNIKQRRQLREVLAIATRSPKAREATLAVLVRKDLPQRAAVDFLRALGDRLVEYAADAQAPVEQLLRSATDWRTRYLLLAPAHRLAQASPPLAAELARIIRSDPNAYVRVEAVRAVGHAELFAADLFFALNDPEVRVRQAAAETLGNYRNASTQAPLLKRLKDDSWPMVRAQAAESLGAQDSTEATDQGLVSALKDDAWTVRVAAVTSLGARPSRVGAEALLDRFEDRKERSEVRAAIASSLGQLCYEPALDTLTDQARKLQSAGMDLRERAVSASALGALGQLHPRDLSERLAPLLSSKDVPPEVRQAAKAALTTPVHCQLPKAPLTATLAEKSRDGQIYQQTRQPTRTPNATYPTEQSSRTGS